MRRTRAKYQSQTAVGIMLPFKAAAELASRRAPPSAGCASGSGGRGAPAGIETLLQAFIGRMGTPENSGRELGSPQWGLYGETGRSQAQGEALRGSPGLCGGPRGSAVIRGALRGCCHRCRLRYRDLRLSTRLLQFHSSKDSSRFRIVKAIIMSG